MKKKLKVKYRTDERVLSNWKNHVERIWFDFLNLKILFPMTVLLYYNELQNVDLSIFSFVIYRFFFQAVTYHVINLIWTIAGEQILTTVWMILTKLTFLKV